MNLVFKIGYALLILLVMVFVVPAKAVYAFFHQGLGEAIAGFSLILDIFLDYK